MMYLWLIPLLLILLIVIVAFYNRGTKNPAPDESRLDQARAQDNPPDLRS